MDGLSFIKKWRSKTLQLGGLKTRLEEAYALQMGHGQRNIYWCVKVSFSVEPIGEKTAQAVVTPPPE